VRIVFDVDGTLIQSASIDAELYARAFWETFGVRLPTTDGSAYRDATDRGVAEEAVRKLGLSAESIADMRRRFVELLSDVDKIAPVPGADTIIATLVSRGATVGIATGSWALAARAKLRAAGIDVGGVALVGSDASPHRHEILRSAVDLIGGDGDAFYVGDAPWDLAASNAANIGFVGVDPRGTGSLGKTFVPDFRDVEAFMHCLSRR
jgi:phosphoglycolate phosphatase-like HAD superfamily hydrolase